MQPKQPLQSMQPMQPMRTFRPSSCPRPHEKQTMNTAAVRALATRPTEHTTDRPRRAGRPRTERQRDLQSRAIFPVPRARRKVA